MWSLSSGGSVLRLGLLPLGVPPPNTGTAGSPGAPPSAACGLPPPWGGIALLPWARRPARGLQRGLGRAGGPGLHLVHVVGDQVGELGDEPPREPVSLHKGLGTSQRGSTESTGGESARGGKGLGEPHRGLPFPALNHLVATLTQIELDPKVRVPPLPTPRPGTSAAPPRGEAPPGAGTAGWGGGAGGPRFRAELAAGGSPWCPPLGVCFVWGGSRVFCLSN